MDSGKPLFWYQGLFLQPHHFQALESFLAQDIASRHRSPYFWGIAKLQLQEKALQNQSLEVLSGEFIFPDGSWMMLPGHARLPARSFKKAWVDTQKPFKVYLGLRRWNASEANVTIFEHASELESISTRFVSDLQPTEVQDSHQGGPAAQLRHREYLLKLFWESEIDRLGEYHLMPLAQLEQIRGEIQLSQNFAPPTFSLKAAPALFEVFRSIRELVLSHCRHLEEFKLSPEMQTPDFRTTYAQYIEALRTLAHAAPLLDHLCETGDLHPWEAYGHLRQLVGELSTFSERVNVLGRLPDGRELLMKYEHEDALKRFQEARLLIQELLEAILVGPQQIIELPREGMGFQANLPLEIFDARFAYYLSVRTSERRDKALDELLHIAKFSTREQIPVLVARSLAGMPLEYSPAPPPGLPKHPGAFYFRLDPSHPVWGEIQRMQNVCLHWDGAPEGTKAELVILRK